MKLRLHLLCFAFLISFSAAFASAVNPRPVPKNETVVRQSFFAFKVSKKFRKGMVEVYQSNGELLAVTALHGRKMVINFADMQSGTYIIIVRKFNTEEHFQFEKR